MADKKTVACIIARTNSTRLPRKVLGTIKGKRMIEYIIEKMKRVKSVDSIYLCTSVDPDDAILLKIAEECGIKGYVGSRTAVIDRMLEVAALEKADNVVRITGDNIFTDEIFLERMIAEHNNQGDAEYTRTEFLPLGVTAEVITVNALARCRELIDPDKSEYLMLYMFDPSIFKCTVLIPPENLRGEYLSLTVDTPADFQRTEFLLGQLYKDGRIFYDDILKLSQGTEVPHIRVDKDSSVKMPDAGEMTYEEFRRNIMGGLIADSRQIFLEEKFYEDQRRLEK